MRFRPVSTWTDAPIDRLEWVASAHRQLEWDYVRSQIQPGDRNFSSTLGVVDSCALRMALHRPAAVAWPPRRPSPETN